LFLKVVLDECDGVARVGVYMVVNLRDETMCAAMHLVIYVIVVLIHSTISLYNVLRQYYANANLCYMTPFFSNNPYSYDKLTTTTHAHQSPRTSSHHVNSQPYKHPHAPRHRTHPTPLSETNNWWMLIDYDTTPIPLTHNTITPDKRPVVIWSITMTCVIIFELTRGTAYGVAAAMIRKTASYTKEITPTIRGTGWCCISHNM
jgi:hypothetical protein